MKGKIQLKKRWEDYWKEWFDGSIATNESDKGKVKEDACIHEIQNKLIDLDLPFILLIQVKNIT